MSREKGTGQGGGLTLARAGDGQLRVCCSGHANVFCFEAIPSSHVRPYLLDSSISNTQKSMLCRVLEDSDVFKVCRLQWHFMVVYSQDLCLCLPLPHSPRTIL